MRDKIMEARVGRDDLRGRRAGSVRGWTMGVGLLASILALAACDAPPQASDPPAASAPAQSPARAAPAKDGFADVDGGRIHYQVYGDLTSGKTPLLVLHGSIMSAEQMRPMIEPFTASRPVIAIDQRGHGRTGDLPGPITYEMLADDAASVLQALNVPTADVLGYSMGGTAAFFMAIRHPDRVGKQIIVSGTARRGGWYPEVQASFAKWTPEMFAGSPLEAEYKRLSPTPEAFPTLIEELSDMDTANYDRSDEAIRSIDDKTMIIVGDADGMQLAYAVELFKLRGGVDVKEAMQGFLSEVPRARLAVLPGTSHTGMMVEAKLLAQLAIPFLDDAKPEMPPGFLKSTNGDEASKGEGVD